MVIDEGSIVKMLSYHPTKKIEECNDIVKAVLLLVSSLCMSNLSLFCHYYNLFATLFICFKLHLPNPNPTKA